jgi:hypothetical protein
LGQAGGIAENPPPVAIDTDPGLSVMAPGETGRLRRVIARHDTARRDAVFSHYGQRCARARAHDVASLIKRAAERMSTSRSLASSAIA